MEELLSKFGEQFLAQNEWKNLPKVKGGGCLLICGMGGSAIAGDILKTYIQQEIKIPIIVNRDYETPNFVDERSIIFISSYSGNTEEVLENYQKLSKITPFVFCISTGGKLFSFNPKYFYTLPPNYPPRCALGWIFTALIKGVEGVGLVKYKTQELKMIGEYLLKLGEEFKIKNSPPYKVAQKLLNKLPIIYTSTTFSSVSRRWATQLNENAKVLAHYNLFPELNHNEIVGFGEPKNVHPLVIILKDESFHLRIKKRISLTKTLYANLAEIIEISPPPQLSFILRVFYLIYFGDWVSYWLAKLRKIDPTPVERISWLKSQLQSGKIFA
jgi:glucose/mannose-6-phosphate isomerase